MIIYWQLDVAKSELEIYSTQQDGLKKQEKEAKENLENGKEKLKDLKRFACFLMTSTFPMLLLVYFM